MSNKLSFAKSDKIKILPVDEKGWEKVDLATPMGLIKVGGEYKAKRFTAGTEYIGILASKYIPFQEIYIVPISVGTVYTVRVEGDCNVGDTLAPVEDGYFQVGAGNLKVVKKINAEIVEAVGISTGQGGGGGQPYTLPIASNIRLGGVKVGDNLKIDQDGKLSAIQQGGGGGNVDGATVNGQAVPLQNKTLEINIDKNTVGLNHVDNTADIDKPISTATQDALDLKADTTAINQEIQDRTDADTTLQNNIDTEAQTREQKDNEINAKVDALNKIVVYAKDLEVKQNWIVLHAGKVYIAKEDITLSTWDVDEPKLILTDSDTISCVSYKENIKIEKGQLVIYQQALYLCDTTIDTTTTWDADKDKMISQQATVDLNDYYNKTEMTQLLNAKQDSLTAGAGINITQNTIKIDDTIYTKNEVNTKINQEIQDRKNADANIKNNIIGDLNTLKTTDKNNIVNAINETYDKAGQGGGGGSVNIVDNITKGDTRKNVVPNPFAVNAFVMSLIPVDIKSDTEFDTGKTLDGKKIYGYYAVEYPFRNTYISGYAWIATIPFGVSKTESNGQLSTVRLPMQCVSHNQQDGIYFIEFSGFTIDNENQNYKSTTVEMRVVPVMCNMPSSWFNGFIFYLKD